MADAIGKVLATFEGLIRRSIAPSVTFFVLFAAGELVAAELAGGSAAAAWRRTAAAVDWQVVAESSGLFATLAILLVLGLGYGLSSVQQLLFDNLLKANFDPGWLLCRLSASARSEARALGKLRSRVLDRIDGEDQLARLAGDVERTDFVLYEVLGGIDPTGTRSFVDSAKAIGVVASSAIAVIAWNLLQRWPLGPVGWGAAVLAVVVWWLGREATLAQYRQRSLRHYANFLAMPDERLQRLLVRPDEEAS